MVSLFKVIFDDKLNYGLKERASGRGLYGMYDVDFFRMVSSLSMLFTFVYTIGMLTYYQYPFELRYIHFWIMAGIYIFLILAFHIIGIPISLSRRLSYKLQNVLYVLRMNYYYFCISLFGIAFIFETKNNTLNDYVYQSNVKIITYLFIYMALMFVFAGFSVLKMIKDGKYSDKDYRETFVPMLGYRYFSVFTIFTGFGARYLFKIQFSQYTLIVMMFFTILFIYMMSFLFVENIIVFMIKIKYNIKCEYYEVPVETRVYYKILTFLKGITPKSVIKAIWNNLFVMIIAFFAYILIIVEIYNMLNITKVQGLAAVLLVSTFLPPIILPIRFVSLIL
ncbi:MAG: hypothetical protein ACRCTA_08130, partial [Bacilli bacterium]